LVLYAALEKVDQNWFTNSSREKREIYDYKGSELYKLLNIFPDSLTYDTYEFWLLQVVSRDIFVFGVQAQGLILVKTRPVTFERVGFYKRGYGILIDDLTPEPFEGFVLRICTWAFWAEILPIVLGLENLKRA
jgi:hypothetical protein